MLPSVQTVLGYLGAGSLFNQAPLINSNTYIPFSDAPSCPTDGAISCHNNTYAGDSCCFVYPGGQLLQTQFWDAIPAIGPADSWTLHGLWPDLCDGSFDQYCSEAPQFHNITAILQDAGQNDLLTYMRSYWLPDRGTPEYFWQHEW